MNFTESMTGKVAVHVTRHALRRAKQRLHWNKSATKRMACRAHRRGLPTKGMLRESENCLPSSGNSVCPILFGEHLFIFTEETLFGEIALLTIYRADREILLTNKRSNIKAKKLGLPEEEKLKNSECSAIRTRRFASSRQEVFSASSQIQHIKRPATLRHNSTKTEVTNYDSPTTNL